MASASASNGLCRVSIVSRQGPMRAIRRPRRGSDFARTRVASMGRHDNPAMLELATFRDPFLPEEPMPASAPRVLPQPFAIVIAAVLLGALSPRPARAHSGAPPP